MENHNPPINMDGDENNFVRHGTPMNPGWMYPRQEFNQYSQYPHMYQEATPAQVSQHMQQVHSGSQLPSQELLGVLPAHHAPPPANHLQHVQVQSSDGVTTSTQQVTIVSNTLPNQSMGTLHDALTNRLSQSINKINSMGVPPLTTPQLVSVQTPPLHHHQNKAAPEPLPTQILTRTRMQDLVREVDPNEQLDEDVEEILLQIADDFVESAITAACLLAKHRKSPTIEVKDLQLHLERNWNMWIPGFGTDELRPYKRSSVNDAHKQRLTLIRKTLKKY